MKFTWIGGPSFLLELGPFVVVGDPVLRDGFELEGAGAVTRRTPASGDVAGADVVLVTAPRADHMDADAIAASGAGTVLIPAVATLEGATPLAAGTSVRLEKGAATLVITALPAGATDNGYFLVLESGQRPFTAYITGDTTFSETTREIQRTHGYANLLVVHAGAERAPDGSLRSADAKEAMQLIYRMQPNAIAAVHHGTFSHYTEPLDPLLERIGLTIYEKRLRVLREGESFQKVIGPSE
jgi:L-ascorbate metabolism protein UlaG (beta-lactamase superfamily)